MNAASLKRIFVCIAYIQFLIAPFILLILFPRLLDMYMQSRFHLIAATWFAFHRVNSVQLIFDAATKKWINKFVFCSHLRSMANWIERLAVHMHFYYWYCCCWYCLLYVWRSFLSFLVSNGFFWCLNIRFVNVVLLRSFLVTRQIVFIFIFFVCGFTLIAWNRDVRLDLIWHTAGDMRLWSSLSPS